MKKALLIVSVLVIAVISTACINNIAVQELNNKAAEYMAKGDYEEAMNRLQASLDLDATLYETYYNLGIAAINAKKYEKAINALENGIKVKSDFADFYYSLGLAQTSYADELTESQDKEIESKDEDAEKKELSNEHILKAIELKNASNDNLRKYLELSSNIKDKETVDALIVENENFIKNYKNKETVAE